MRIGFFRKGVSDTDAPFALWGVFLVFCWFPSSVYPAPVGGCAADAATERVRVGHVYDGDTVKLTDGRRLRFIGINTPEIGHNGQPDQVLALQARAALQEILHTHNQILFLQYGEESQDHYGRLLAHAYLEDGTDVAVRLLEQGLATTLVVPPNTRVQECYQHHEDEAREAARGLWALPDYQPVDNRTLHPDSRGFRIVRGRVTDIRQSRYSIWLDLDGPVTLHVNRKDLVNFQNGFPASTLHRTVVVRGWITANKNRLRIKVRHPAALQAEANAIPGK